MNFFLSLSLSFIVFNYSAQWVFENYGVVKKTSKEKFIVFYFFFWNSKLNHTVYFYDLSNFNIKIK